LPYLGVRSGDCKVTNVGAHKWARQSGRRARHAPASRRRCVRERSMRAARAACSRSAIPDAQIQRRLGNRACTGRHRGMARRSTIGFELRGTPFRDLPRNGSRAARDGWTKASRDKRPRQRRQRDARPRRSRRWGRAGGVSGARLASRPIRQSRPRRTLGGEASREALLLRPGPAGRFWNRPPAETALRRARCSGANRLRRGGSRDSWR